MLVILYRCAEKISIESDHSFFLAVTMITIVTI